MNRYSESRIKKALSGLKSEAPPEFAKSVMNMIIVSEKRGFSKSWWVVISLGITFVVTLAIVFGSMGENFSSFNLSSKDYDQSKQPGGNLQPTETITADEAVRAPDVITDGFVIVKVFAPNPFEYAKLIEAKLSSRGELYLTDQQGFPVLNLIVPASETKQALDFIRSVGGEGVYHQIKEERQVPQGSVNITILITTK